MLRFLNPVCGLPGMSILTRWLHSIGRIGDLLPNQQQRAMTEAIPQQGATLVITMRNYPAVTAPALCC
jgi:hypothetical protein